MIPFNLSPFYFKLNLQKNAILGNALPVYDCCKDKILYPTNFPNYVFHRKYKQ